MIINSKVPPNPKVMLSSVLNFVGKPILVSLEINRIADKNSLSKSDISFFIIAYDSWNSNNNIPDIAS